MRRALLLLTTTLAVAGTLASTALAIGGFRSPSGNIGCAGYGSSVRCDIRTTTNGLPPKPKNCDLDYGSAYGVNLSSKRGYRLCAGDTVLDPRRPTRAYGTSWRFRSITCRVRQSGVTCKNAKGHGFFLSKARQRLF
jgi:hypothetical protein